MRKVTNKICRAFLAGDAAREGNTETNGHQLFLHGSEIAFKAQHGIVLSLRGYNTPTTRERLNGLLHLLGDDRRFTQQDHGAFFDDQPIDPDTVIYL